MNVLQCLQNYEDEWVLEEYDHDDGSDIQYCKVCREAISGPHYVRRYSSLHESCAELPGMIQHPLHPDHPLRIRHCSLNRADDLICDGCQTYSFTYKYECKICNVKLDYQCISKYVEGQVLKERVDKVTDYHQHKLQLLYFPFEVLQELVDEDNYCMCCLKGIQDSAYVCLKCGFSINASCLDKIPKQVKSSFHPQHHLRPRIVYANKSKCCQVCQKEVHGIELSCSICEYSFHVSCGKYIRPGIRLRDHEHKLYYFDCWDLSSSDCNICHQKCQGPIYRCIKRGINFHVECLISSVVNHECHDHQLTLTNSVVPRGNASKYRCDVCEEEEDFEHYVYHCEECYFMAHIECLFFEEENPPLVGSDEVRDAETEDDRKAEKSKKKNSDEETDSSETDSSEEESDLEAYSPSKLNEKIIHVTAEIHELTIKLDLLKKMYAEKFYSQS